MSDPSRPYRLLLTGSRHHEDKALIWGVLDEYHAAHPDMVVVHGACYPKQNKRGNRPDTSADWLAHLWCETRGVPDEPHPADWSIGLRAGPVRNQAMVELGASVCVGFPIDFSAGTFGCMRMAKAAGIPVRRWPDA